MIDDVSGVSLILIAFVFGAVFGYTSKPISKKDSILIDTHRMYQKMIWNIFIAVCPMMTYVDTEQAYHRIMYVLTKSEEIDEQSKTS